MDFYVLLSLLKNLPRQLDVKYCVYLPGTCIGQLSNTQELVIQLEDLIKLREALLNFCDDSHSLTLC